MTKPRTTDLTVGLDIGFGMTKIVTADRSLIFPSVYGYAREVSFRPEELAQRYPGMQISDDGGDWFVGGLAYAQFTPEELLSLHGRTGSNDIRLRLAKTAIGQLLGPTRSADVMYLRVATGLPVSHMSESAALKQTLIGPHRIQTDMTDVVVDIVECHVMPQPYGTIYSQTLTPAGSTAPGPRPTRIGVCDVGTYTVDIAQENDGMYVEAASDSAESGAHLALERIAALLERRFGEKIPFDMVDKALRTGYFTAFGEQIDLRHEVSDAMEPVRSATINLLRRKWRKAVTVESILLTGGPAPSVYDVVKKEYPQTLLVDDSQMANALGYFNYARLVEVYGLRQDA